MFSSTPPGMLSRTLPIALDGTLPETLSSTLPCTLSGTLPTSPDDTPSLLDCTLLSKVSGYAQLHLQVALNYDSEHTLMYTPNCTPWYTPSALGSTPPSTHSMWKTPSISLDYMLPCMLLHAQSRDWLSYRHQVPEGVTQMACSG